MTQLENIKLEVERKKKENMNLKEDLEKIQLELVERIALKERSTKFQDFIKRESMIHNGLSYKNAKLFFLTEN